MENEIMLKEDAAVALAEHFDMAELIKPLTREIFLFDTFISGTTHLEDASVLNKLKVGDKLSFVREPDNRYDDKAIVIQNTDKEKLGYVPEKDNVVFARLMDAGKKLGGKVNEIKDKHGFTQVAIGIYLIDF
ncbi:MAG: HIRAN domain-containing protein [Lachnospiraceae bacterium]|nr:HIRAN domain-containing protein [Lachnospiraceae bacterium]